MLEFKHVFKTFNRNSDFELVLFQDLNFAIAKDEFVVIIGSNGSGKSTLFNLLGGQVSPESGKILFEGKDLNQKTHHSRAKEIGRVYQDPLMGTAPSLSILENLSLAKNQGQLLNFKKGKLNNERVYFKNLLKQLDMNLEDKLDNKVSLLSGGQRQAISLLMALLKSPKLLLLDEHTAALDPKSSKKIIEITNHLLAKHHTTTIMITHNIQEALENGNRLLMFNQGEIILDVKNQAKAALKKEDIISLFHKYNQNSFEIIN